MKFLARRISYSLFMLLCIFCVFPCYAQTLNPPEVNNYIGNQTPLGSGSVSSLLFKLYDITVWTKGDRLSWNQPFALRLKYARNFSSKAIVDASLSEMNNIKTLDKATMESDRKVFASLFPDVNAGDTITAIYQPDNALIFFYNDRKIGTIKNMQLAKEFLDIWLSPRASHAALRNKIINQ